MFPGWKREENCCLRDWTCVGVESVGRIRLKEAIVECVLLLLHCFALQLSFWFSFGLGGVLAAVLALPSGYWGG